MRRSHAAFDFREKSPGNFQQVSRDNAYRAVKQDYDHRYLEFIHLFNTQKYWHAHEALEHLWLENRECSDRTFYKALIQLAAVLYHVEKTNFTGAWALFDSASRYLADYPNDHLGIKTGELLEAIRKFTEGRQKEGSRTGAVRPIIKI